MKSFMISYSNSKCWDIMNCDNLDCLAREESDTPCWTIAKRVMAYHSISNTCRDCVAFLLKEGSSVLNKKQEELLKKNGTCHQVCILKS